MKRNTFNYRQNGSSATGYGEIEDYGQERYQDLLREAEQSRLASRATRSSANSQPASHAKSPITRLLTWVGLF